MQKEEGNIAAAVVVVVVAQQQSFTAVQHYTCTLLFALQGFNLAKTSENLVKLGANCCII